MKKWTHRVHRNDKFEGPYRMYWDAQQLHTTILIIKIIPLRQMEQHKDVNNININFLYAMDY